MTAAPAKSAREKALELVDRYVDDIDADGGHDKLRRHEDRIAAAIEEARREAIEECRRIADDEAEGYRLMLEDHPTAACGLEAAQDIASRIGALAQGERGEE
jgi:hypothetical protein